MTERFTISLEVPLAKQFDTYIRAKGYTNRSEAVRDFIRQRLDEQQLASGEGGHCVAALSYVYDHHELDLAARLTRAQHEHHDLILATQHVHLDHDTCLETAMLRGPVRAVRAFAEGVIASRGVRHGNLHIIAAKLTPSHEHGVSEHHHFKPVT
jgi:CopG family transcriptional regulator, nickel-responsive regulator